MKNQEKEMGHPDASFKTVVLKTYHKLHPRKKETSINNLKGGKTLDLL